MEKKSSAELQRARLCSVERGEEDRKKSYGRVLERLELLCRHGIELGDLGEAAKCPIDDVLDAAAAAWSAHRIASGLARSLPGPPELVAGRPVAIWY